MRLERSINGVCRRLGTSKGANTWTVKARIELLGLDTSHFGYAPISTPGLAEAVAKSRTIAEVVRALGLPLDSATHTKVRRRIVKSGLDVSHLVRTRKRATRTRRWSEAQLREAVERSTSIAMVARMLGIVAAGGNYETIRNSIAELGLDTKHFKAGGWFIGRKLVVNRIALHELLVAGRWTGTQNLKQRLFDEKLKTPACELCGWAERSKDGRVPVELDHINGDRNDNRLENLRILCPNCHSLQATHRGLNKKSRRR